MDEILKAMRALKAARSAMWIKIELCSDGSGQLLEPLNHAPGMNIVSMWTATADQFVDGIILAAIRSKLPPTRQEALAALGQIPILPSGDVATKAYNTLRRYLEAQKDERCSG